MIDRCDTLPTQNREKNCAQNADTCGHSADRMRTQCGRPQKMRTHADRCGHIRSKLRMDIPKPKTMTLRNIIANGRGRGRRPPSPRPSCCSACFSSSRLPAFPSTDRRHTRSRRRRRRRRLPAPPSPRDSSATSSSSATTERPTAPSGWEEHPKEDDEGRRPAATSSPGPSRPRRPGASPRSVVPRIVPSAVPPETGGRRGRRHA